MAALKESMLEEVRSAVATGILDSRQLGFSQIRLLPKGRDLRPIMNLRRRIFAAKGNTKVLGPSINNILDPVYKVLRLEKVSHRKALKVWCVADTH